MSNQNVVPGDETPMMLTELRVETNRGSFAVVVEPGAPIALEEGAPPAAMVTLLEMLWILMNRNQTSVVSAVRATTLHRLTSSRLAELSREEEPQSIMAPDGSLYKCMSCVRSVLRYSATHPHGLRLDQVISIGWRMRDSDQWQCPVCSGVEQ